MPITTFQTILSTDKLQSGFRAKFNANVALLITDIVDNGDGTATVELQGGTNFVVDLGTSFYTKPEVQALITAVQAAVWGAITGNVEDQTDVVGNLGVITPIDDIVISCNFAVDAADTDNPFFGFPASGYSSFSVPGITGTGWQLLIKEGATTDIKFRVYSSGAWGAWKDLLNRTPTTYEVPFTGSGNYTINWQTDLIDGVNTFVEILGDNLPKPVLYFDDGSGNFTNAGTVPTCNRTAGVLNTVTFDLGPLPVTVVIVF